MVNKDKNIDNNFASDGMRDSESNHDRIKPDILNYWLDHIQLDEKIEREMDQAEHNILSDIHERMDSRRSKLGFHYRYFAVAASLVIVVILSGFFLFNMDTHKVDHPLLTVNTPLGVQTELTLPDGSKVWLNGGSSLSYPEKFENGSRHVTLSGEAYFDVQHDKEAPFTVHSGHMKLNVLGTTFNVEAYEGDEYMNITLETGKISMHFNDQPKAIMLNPNQQLIYNKITQETQMLDIEASKITGWSEGRLYFTAMPLKEIARKLKRYYDVDFTFASQNVADIIYTIEFVGNESIDEILNIWSMDNRIKFVRENNNIIVIE